ncbi:MAG: hypothetical protein H0T79_07400 [Deltaproteobacteria bacterium]|nr:hypothetical protein [Deltaproteobacteria bacterium]
MLIASGGVQHWNGSFDGTVPVPNGGIYDLEGPDRAHLWALGAGGLFHFENGSFVLAAAPASNERFLNLVVVGDAVWVVASLDEVTTPRTVIVHRDAAGAVDREVLPADGSKLFVVGDTLWLVGAYLATRPL